MDDRRKILVVSVFLLIELVYRSTSSTTPPEKRSHTTARRSELLRHLEHRGLSRYGHGEGDRILLPEGQVDPPVVV